MTSGSRASTSQTQEMMVESHTYPPLRAGLQMGARCLQPPMKRKAPSWQTSSFHPPPALLSVPDDYHYLEPVEEWTEIMQEQLATTINKLSPYKAPGLDGIANIVFQRCHQLLNYLLPLFNTTIKLHMHYDPWRESITIILCKPGKPDYSLPKAYCCESKCGFGLE